MRKVDKKMMFEGALGDMFIRNFINKNIQYLLQIL